MDIGLLVLRLVVGTAMAAHGSQKLFGWFGGAGPKGTGAWFESIGFRPGAPFATAAGLAELAGGTLFALGLLGPLPAAIIISVLVVAIAAVHAGHGFFAATNGVEVPVLYIAAALAVAFAGPGAFSLDHLLGLEPLTRRIPGWAAPVLGVAGALGNLALRRVVPAEPPAAHRA